MGNAFGSVIPDVIWPRVGHCFRFVPDYIGRPKPCPEPIVARGIFVDAENNAHKVDACAEHAGELTGQVLLTDSDVPMGDPEGLEH